MQFPKISIVTPSFNQGKYIEHTILSIINQVYPNVEYIIIDGGSTDETIDIIKKYEDRITYWVSEPDKGQSDAINKGLAKCTGEIFNWINSDDYLEPGALHVIAKAFMENKDALQVSGYTRIFNDATNTTVLLHRCELFENTETTVVQQRINQPGAFYRSSIFSEIGKINMDLVYVMDLELWLRFLSRFGQQKIVLLNNTVAHFRIHTNSKTNEFEIRFRKESEGLNHHILAELKCDKALVNYFVGNENYHPTQWQYAAIDTNRFISAIAKQYFYAFYKAKNYKATKIAMKQMLRERKFVYSWNNFRIILKIYFGI